MNPVPKADERKPDSDEPYRYVCPDCGCQVTGRRTKLGGQYVCPACEETYEKRALKDLKRERDPA